MSPREELELLLAAAVRKALAEAKERNAFMPFALTLTRVGERFDITIEEPDSRDPSSAHAEILERVGAEIAAGHSRAVAVAHEIELVHTISNRKTAAVQVTLDHLDADAITCTMPYTWRHGSVITAELVATAPVIRFFAAGGSSAPSPTTAPSRS